VASDTTWGFPSQVLREYALLADGARGATDAGRGSLARRRAPAALPSPQQQQRDRERNPGWDGITLRGAYRPPDGPGGRPELPAGDDGRAEPRANRMQADGQLLAGRSDVQGDRRAIATHDCSLSRKVGQVLRGRLTGQLAAPPGPTVDLGRARAAAAAAKQLGPTPADTGLCRGGVEWAGTNGLGHG
jgi:hypothetical protein